MTATDYAVSPGEYLQEWAQGADLTQQQVADLIGASRKFINDLVHGRAPVTAETAQRLQRVTGIPVAAWLRYEMQYRADLARLADEESLAQHVDDIAPAAATYLRRIGATSATRRQPGQLVSDFLTFHGCGTWSAYEQRVSDQHAGEFALAALKEPGSQIHHSVLMSWLRAGERTTAFERGCRGTFNADALRAVLPSLRDRTSRPDARMPEDVANLLGEVGVVFLLVAPPAQLPLYGVTRFVREKVPVIQQTGRRTTDGFFTWTLFHELGHLLNDPRGEVHLEYSTTRKRNSAAEKAANTFAFQTLFGSDGLERLRGVTHDSEIVTEAHALGLSPGVVVHQLRRRRQLPYSHGARLSVDLAGVTVE